jgi:SAM-dependent methyltransferase
LIEATVVLGVKKLESEKQLPLPGRSEEASESKPSYFELHAYVGTTKHMGGAETTKTLAELCQIHKGTYVLDVGCGVGATASHLVKTYGCQVVGVDIREAMIARSNERAQKEGIQNQVEFRTADAKDLPFEDALFDAVICESVATFVEDKQRMVSECARVTRLGGYAGLNEEIWIKTPSAEMVEYAKRTWEIQSDIPTADDWVRILETAGLRDITVKTYEFSARREATQLKRYHLSDIFRMLYRTLLLYVKSPAFREYMRERRKIPQDLFAHLGYGIFVGRR